MTTESTASVLLEQHDGIATITLNRPQTMNALDVQAAQAFHTVCRQLSTDPGVRVVILRGAGKAFGVGGDLAAFTEEAGVPPSDIIDPMHAAVQLLAALNAPVIASLHGVVAGGSLSLSMACDLAIAADNTRFNLAYANVAANCDLSGSWNLPRMVGLRNAMQIALLSDTFDAAEALRLGLINRVVPPEQLEAETSVMAQRLAAGPTLAYGRMKRLIRQSFETALPAQLKDEGEQFTASSKTADFKEAMMAFFAKRKAQFKGH